MRSARYVCLVAATVAALVLFSCWEGVQAAALTAASKAPAASLPPPPLRLLPGGANQFPGGTFNPR